VSGSVVERVCACSSEKKPHESIRKIVEIQITWIDRINAIVSSRCTYAQEVA
jgi:ribosomal protein S12